MNHASAQPVRAARTRAGASLHARCGLVGLAMLLFIFAGCHHENGTESVVASDRNAYILDAGRVVADTSAVLQFKAVYADEVKTRDIPVTVKEK